MKILNSLLLLLIALAVHVSSFLTSGSSRTPSSNYVFSNTECQLTLGGLKACKAKYGPTATCTTASFSQPKRCYY